MKVSGGGGDTCMSCYVDFYFNFEKKKKKCIGRSYYHYSTGATQGSWTMSLRWVT